ncbi:MAG: phosphoribosylaminoimidazolesuccinocarboxamide synthase [Spirochaetales bacterium]|nr:phosphoribosylaminoimidazolesuccinocarboxamide synthase [Spirochaetales bacterium]
MNNEQIADYLGKTFRGYKRPDNLPGISMYEGKVRDVFSGGDRMVISTSDRISAFDRVLSTIPLKGQVLNEIALYWFEQTADIISNHIIKKLSPRAVLVERCEVLPIEVVVRGYLTGSAWRDYQKGNPVSGIALPEGMKMNQKFAAPLLTPSTKEEFGKHDLPISTAEIVSRGLVREDIWKEVEDKAMRLFARGTELAAGRGLILVDTKYEFGIKNGELLIVDEIHTPDSSRFWYADTYSQLFNEGSPQRKVDKEYLRQWLMDKGFSGNGEAPHIPDDVRVEVAARYIRAYEEISGRTFVPDEKILEIDDIIEILE